MTCGSTVRRRRIQCRLVLILVPSLVLASCGQTDPKPQSKRKPSSSGGEAVAQDVPPRIVSSVNKKSDDNDENHFDGIVVGSGISGLSAALELARGGANVCLIEMSSVFGGHAVMSQGSVSIVGTPVQAAAGIVDSPDLAFDDIVRFGDDPNLEWARYYVQNSRTEIYDWLTELGVDFHAVDSSPGNSVMREHQPKGRGLGLVTPIYRACLELSNLKFVWHTKVEQLLIEDGRVHGVVGRNLRTETEQTFRASYTVLATGGFQSNLDMVREFWPAEFRFPDRILVGSGHNSTGMGHRLAESAGGDLVKMDHQWNYFTGIPDHRYPGTKRGLSAANMHGIIVNSEGRQFANLWGWAKEVMPKLFQQKEATLWFIFDEASKRKFVVSGSDWVDFQKVEREILKNPDVVQVAGTLEELAQKSGLPPENLVETVRRYNELVDKGVDEDFHRFGPDRPAYANAASPRISTPPYYAMQAYPLTRKSMGGVSIDLDCQVIDKQQQTIPGLYAVGELTGLAGINGKAALEGTFLGPCVVTGRVAARAILRELKRPVVAEVDKSTNCASCHDVTADVAARRPGYWHYENVHRIVMERGTDCRRCHAELSPYQEETHKVNPQSLTASCVNCHIARE